MIVTNVPLIPLIPSVRRVVAPVLRLAGADTHENTHTLRTIAVTPWRIRSED